MPDAKLSRIQHWRWLIAVTSMVALATCVAISDTAIESRSKSYLVQLSNFRAPPSVLVTRPGDHAIEATFELPARLIANYRAPISAQISGYLKKRRVDVGSRVKSGDVVAEIEVPNLDRNLLEARTRLASLESRARLSEATLSRYLNLAGSNFVSQEDIDDRKADLESRRADVLVVKDNVSHLEALRGLKHVTTPFSGIVTERNFDEGAPVTKGEGGGLPIFVVSSVEKLHLYIDVPEEYARAVRVGANALVTIPEQTHVSLRGVVEAISQAVDVRTGTAKVRLALDDVSEDLMPGNYANLRLSFLAPCRSLQVPSSALILRDGKVFVATVENGERVGLKQVEIARDLGISVELSSGLDFHHRIIVSPPVGLANGDPVKIKWLELASTQRTS
jgi:membrane fusion protein, multidrug efflux system